MIVNKNLKENKNISLALGFFDGVHFAHQKLIEKTVELARQNSLKSVLLTFEKSPYSIISKTKEEYITPLNEKLSLIEKLGIDEVYVLDFNLYKNLQAEDYINEVIIKYFNPKFIVTGFNHTFGAKRGGDAAFLSSLKACFKYVEIEPVRVKDTIVSSTNIKNLIKDGNIELANSMLNRNFSYKGIVVEGNKIGRTLGYKTANLIWNDKIVKPKYGVYTGSVIFEDKIYPSLINFGIRPSLDINSKEVLEVHILDFNSDIYNKEIEVRFKLKLRDEIKFSSIEDLKKQIDKDYTALKSLV